MARNLLKELKELRSAGVGYVRRYCVVEHERVQEIVANLSLLARGTLRRRGLKREAIEKQKASRT
jgi:hypothetical protein